MWGFAGDLSVDLCWAAPRHSTLSLLFDDVVRRSALGVSRHKYLYSMMAKGSEGLSMAGNGPHQSDLVPTKYAHNPDVDNAPFSRLRCRRCSRSRLDPAVVSGPRVWAPRPKSEPGKLNIIQIRSVRAPLRDKIRLIRLRPGHGRPQWSTSLKRDPQHTQHLQATFQLRPCPAPLDPAAGLRATSFSDIRPAYPGPSKDFRMVCCGKRPKAEAPYADTASGRNSPVCCKALAAATGPVRGVARNQGGCRGVAPH